MTAVACSNEVSASGGMSGAMASPATGSTRPACGCGSIPSRTGPEPPQPVMTSSVKRLAAASAGTFVLLDLVAEPARDDARIALFRQDREQLKRTLIDEARAKGEKPTPVIDLLLGTTSGSLGETSALLILLVALVLEAGPRREGRQGE